MNSNLTSRLEKIEQTLDSYMDIDAESTRAAAVFGALPAALRRGHTVPLVNPGNSLIKRGGKRWRPLLGVLSCELAGGRPEDMYPLVPLIELCHTASLIHDDIEDNSAVRRGKAAVHIEYGVGPAINAGSWLYFYAAQAISASSMDEKKQTRAYSCYLRCLSALHLGQAMDIDWHLQEDYIPSQAEYEAMIRLKTGSLARLAGEMGFTAAGRSAEEAAEYGALTAEFGMGFQILDDVKNIKGGIAGKEYGDDIVEGKKSLPVILYLEKNPSEKDRLKKLFQQAAAEGIQSPAVRECTDLFLSSGATGRAEEHGRQIVETSLIKFQERYGRNDTADLIAELFSSVL